VTNLILLVFLFKDAVKKWFEGSSSGPSRPRGGERPVNEFFNSRAPERSELEVQEMADRLLDRIDRKIEVLRELIKQADRRIDSLGRTSYTLPAELPGMDAGESAPAREPERRARPGFPPPPHAPDAPEDEKRMRILQLRRKGFTPAQIAREVNMGRGEVELILNVEGMI